MTRSVPRVLAALLFIGCFATAASAAPIVGVGLFSFDSDGSVDTFNITNLTGSSALAPDFPITTPLTFTVTGLTANTSGGGTLSLTGSAFSTDAFGNVNCTAAGDAATGGCNFAAYTLLSAVITGTLSPTSGLAGLPPGTTGILANFSASLTPACETGSLSAGCDATVINATTTSPVPEPSTLIQLGMGVLAGGYRFRRHPLLARLTSRRA